MGPPVSSPLLTDSASGHAMEAYCAAARRLVTMVGGPRSLPPHTLHTRGHRAAARMHAPPTQETR